VHGSVVSVGIVSVVSVRSFVCDSVISLGNFVCIGVWLVLYSIVCIMCSSDPYKADTYRILNFVKYNITK
jgi:hypothetical protein